ncbi:family 16 glycosylhydrolase [Cryomorpha ignava]|uniref:Family 16 glycosylhydrolase n=2 Tax=Cryomorpha ignava TaxID=101383 RepID=A0A7K3WQH6_9FLAO|nr:family 16 glycosylhydrolase [Cryomorpha ignava]
MVLSKLNLSFTILLCVAVNCTYGQPLTIQDDFEGNGTIESWYASEAQADTAWGNPFQEGVNLSSRVMRYRDLGGQYAHVGFTLPASFDLSENHSFTLKIFIPSATISGSQNNQVSLKLQNAAISQPWATQTEIIKEVQLDQWQEVSFDFENDAFINANMNSDIPVNRTDFNRVILQVNGENNADLVQAYFDDFYYDGEIDLTNDPTGNIYNHLVWSDEFDGSEIDADKWHYQTQIPTAGGWYNNELQHYTDREENAFVEDGFLNIVAIREDYTDQGLGRNFTSARLNSKFAFTYGKMEVRAKLPFGYGTWPAIWTLGKNIIEPGAFWSDQYGQTFWPACGEIDVMEHWGTNQNYVQAALHTPSSFGATENHGGLYINDVSNTFHTYGMVWTPELISFSVDGNIYYTYQPENQNMDNWPYIADQYILLNVAMQNPVNQNFTESAMVVDYVRVYQEGALNAENALSENDIQVYPNPFNQDISIHLKNSLLGSQVRVYSILGEELASYFQNQNIFRLALSDLPSGTYIIQVLTEKGTLEKKVIKL